MTVEGRSVDSAGDGGAADHFPVGMRVLAVDDDPICLKVLEHLLRKCQYHVTTTKRSIEALKMLRENRNKVDLVISDVNMPDMDGFKLLELVGLEMDLPVIMLSAHSDTELVMKGIAHGACDYLLKPVRIEELKNIWQHVIRRKKLEPKAKNKFPNQDNVGNGGSEGEQGFSSTSNADNAKLNRKRKEQDDDEDEEGKENEVDIDDPSNLKRPRVVWSVELHRKFVSAVNQLGLEKAVPKKILDLMNVEGLTRENVASHLQKYRLYLKRISNVASQQANLAATFGSKEGTYMRIGSYDGYGDMHGFAGSGRLPSSSLSYYSPVGMSLIQQSSHNLNCAISNLGSFQPAIMLPPHQATNLLQGIPTSLELGHLQHSKSTTSIGEAFDIDFGCSSFLDPDPSNGNWQGAAQLLRFSATLNPNEEYPIDQLQAMNSSISSAPSTNRNISVVGSVSAPLLDSRDLQCQAGVGVVDSMPKQSWEEHEHDYARSPLSQSFNQNSLVCERKVGSSLIVPSNDAQLSFPQHSVVEKLGPNTKTNADRHDGSIQGSFESLDDMMNAMIKQKPTFVCCFTFETMAKKEMEVVKGLDLEKYMGRWYEIASIPSRNQPKNGVNTRATYTLKEDGTVKVVNETWSDGKRSCIEGVAYKAEPSSQEAKFKVKFYLPPFLPIIPVVGNYWVLYIDGDYQYVLVGEPSRKNLWILCRNTHLNEEIYNELLEKAKELGYDVNKLHKTPQSDPPPEGEGPKDTKGIWWIKSILLGK